MQYTLLTAALGLTSVSSAFILPNTPRGSASLLRLPLTATRRTALSSKRQEPVEIDNSQHGTRYFVDVFVGTPKQPTTLDLDTGSSNTWVNPQCSTAGSDFLVQECENIPQFAWRDSTTLVNEGIPMNQTYGIGWAQGVFVTDNFYIGDVKITKQEIGIAGQSGLQPVGILGVSPMIGGTGNPTVVDNMASQGITKSRAFSIDLRGADTPVGSIIFGGLDTKKYEGSLEKLPIIPPAETPDQADRFWVYMSSVGITKPGQKYKKYPASSTNPKGQAIFLDTGSTLSSFPDSLVKSIVADFPGATYISDNDVWTVDCKYASQDGTVDFGFGKTVIQVPYKEFIWQPSAGNCYLGMVTNEETILLGDSFLRSAYVVYDQDNRNLHVAPVANCGTNLVEIGTGPDAVPSIVGECNKPPTSTTTTSHSKTTSASKTSSSGTTTEGPATTSSGSYPTHSYPATGYPVSSYPVDNSTASGSMSTVYATTTYTISSCAPTVTSCPYGHVTTETVSQYTTWCPATEGYPTQTTPIGTGTGYPTYPPQSTGTSTPAPPITNSAGKSAINFVSVVIAAFAAIVML